MTTQSSTYTAPSLTAHPTSSSSLGRRETHFSYTPLVYIATFVALVAAAVKFNLVSVKVEPVELEELLLEKIQAERERATVSTAAEAAASSSDEQQIKVSSNTPQP